MSLEDKFLLSNLQEHKLNNRLDEQISLFAYFYCVCGFPTIHAKKYRP